MKKLFNLIIRFYKRVLATNKIAFIAIITMTVFLLYWIILMVFSTFGPMYNIKSVNQLPVITNESYASVANKYTGREDIYHLEIKQGGEKINLDLGVGAEMTNTQAINLADEILFAFQAENGWSVPEGQVWSNELKSYEISVTIDKQEDSESFPIFGTKIRNKSKMNWTQKNGVRSSQFAEFDQGE